ncbi:MAG: alanine racemase [Patescibacteria group bacterium]|jgi:alanine racemase
MALTWIEINKKDILHNIRQFKNLAPNSEFWPVVKSNAYGHGSKEIVTFLKDNEDVAGFMVASLEEALEIKSLTKKLIIVLSYFDREDTKSLEKVDKQISLPIYDLETIDYLAAFNKSFLLNIKIDTGTARLGFAVEDLPLAVDKIENTKNLKIFSIFTHYAESESEDQNFSKQQLAIFNKATKDYKQYKLHSACSAATIALPEAQSNIIRIGLSFYGLWPSEATKRRAWMSKMCLQPLLTWKTKVIQIKQLKKGASIGYNRTYKCVKDCKIAVLPIGYNEGYGRLLSNSGEVLIKGQRCPIRGNICMNLSMVEIPDDLDIQIGEIVTLIGTDSGQNISVDDIAKKCQTINYEIVTKIKHSLPRVLV